LQATNDIVFMSAVSSSDSLTLTASDVTLSDSAGLSTTISAGSLKIDDGILTPVEVGSGGSGGFISFSGGSGGGTLTVSAEDIKSNSTSGDLIFGIGEVRVEPSGGGPGGRITTNPNTILLTDELGAVTITIHRTDGLVLVLGPSGTSAVYNAAGVQLTGSTAREFAANPDAISLTRPSTFDAWRVDLNDAVNKLSF